MTKDEIILAQQARIEQLKSVAENVVLSHNEILPIMNAYMGSLGTEKAWAQTCEVSDAMREALSTPDDLSALRAHDAALLAPYQWQPIETAPKDGTEVILWFPFKGIAINGLYGEVSEGDWETGNRTWMEWLVADELWFQEDPSQAPTHWMPLPSTEAIEKGGV